MYSHVQFVSLPNGRLTSFRFINCLLQTLVVDQQGKHTKHGKKVFCNIHDVNQAIQWESLQTVDSTQTETRQWVIRALSLRTGHSRCLCNRSVYKACILSTLSTKELPMWVRSRRRHAHTNTRVTPVNSHSARCGRDAQKYVKSSQRA